MIGVVREIWSLEVSMSKSLGWVGGTTHFSSENVSCINRPKALFIRVLLSRLGFFPIAALTDSLVKATFFAFLYLAP
jgi:hypothetical protein